MASITTDEFFTFALFQIWNSPLSPSFFLPHHPRLFSFCAYEIFTAHDVNVSSRNLPTNEGSFLFDTSGFVTAPYGGYFKFMKKLIVTKLLGPNAQVQSRSIRADELERLRGILLDKGRKKERVDINKEARKLVGNIVARMTMGGSFTEENGDIESIQSLVAKANASKIKTALSVLIFGQLEKLGISWFKRRTVFKKFDRLLERFLMEHKEKPNGDRRIDMMDVLLAVSEDENAEYKITRNNIKLIDIREEGEIDEGEKEDVEEDKNVVQETNGRDETATQEADPKSRGAPALNSQANSQKGKGKNFKKPMISNKSFIQAVKSTSNKEVSSRRK
ncbi:hypothetical protein DY000_02061934 [Brassica cretica]|uniref:Uncharacterized protein n=1 Tax=Brassica cretica TaxID=69181 RepID=A0ABQ7AR29_BRACR|nr:hypothetical protein DY000_02061934 [Brassica cretica]